MWDELGIEATSDSKVIRRAYARRLRTIDPDGDPAAFQRLRAAFERALAWAQGKVGQEKPAAARRSQVEPQSIEQASQSYSGRLPVLRSAPEQQTPTARDGDYATALGASDEATNAFLSAFKGALTTGDPRPAFAHLVAASAKGLLPLALKDELFAELMAVAVKNHSLPAEHFRAMARLGNWDTASPRGMRDRGTLRAEVLLRLEAESWYEGMLAAAARNGAWFRQNRKLFRGPGGRTRLYGYAHERSAARVVLAHAARWRFYDLGVQEQVKHMLVWYDRYRQWLDDRIEPDHLAWLRRVALRPAWRNDLMSLGWIVAVVVLGLTILALSS